MMIRAVRLLVGKELRQLIRSRGLLLALLVYPVAVAALMGVLLQDAQHRATIALVNQDTTGKALDISGAHFGIDEYRKQAEASGITVKDMDYDRAMAALDDGQVSGVLVIPQGFMAKLRTTLSPSEVEFHTGNNALGDQITERVRGAIYRLNLKISRALIKENASYLKQIVTGGGVTVLDHDYHLYGLQQTKEDLTRIRASQTDPQTIEDLDNIISFADDAETALGLADNALNATAAPVRLDHVTAKGKSPQLTAKAMSFAIAVSLSFMCIIFVAASLAGERDERVLGRLLHGRTRGWHVLAAKLVVGSLLGLLFSLGLFVVFAVLAPQAWSRLPLLLGCTLVAGLSFSSIGTVIAVLARDARTATLVSLLLVLPIIPLVFAPTGSALHSVSQLLPFAPAMQTFNSALFDTHPASMVGRGIAQLLAFAVVATGVASRLLHRLT